MQERMAKYDHRLRGIGSSEEEAVKSLGRGERRGSKIASKGCSQNRAWKNKWKDKGENIPGKGNSRCRACRKKLEEGSTV